MGVRAEVIVESRFGVFAADLPDRLVRGENVAAEALLGFSLEEVPFDIGTLAGSGAVEPATDPDEGAAVSYDTPYAARLHEHPEFNFSKDSNPGAKGKYLEDPALERKAELGAIMVAEVLRG